MYARRGTIRLLQTAENDGFTTAISAQRCTSAQVKRWGKERTGTQPYRCFGWRRTFNDRTRTAMAGTHLPAKWQA